MRDTVTPGSKPRRDLSAGVQSSSFAAPSRALLASRGQFLGVGMATSEEGVRSTDWTVEETIWVATRAQVLCNLIARVTGLHGSTSQRSKTFDVCLDSRVSGSSAHNSS